jgi:hypothetical protein
MKERAGRNPDPDDEFITAIAQSYGFKNRDFSVIWDGGSFDGTRVIHNLVIETADGRQSTLQIGHSDLGRRDRWKYVHQIQVAFAGLARRNAPRGE